MNAFKKIISCIISVALIMSVAVMPSVSAVETDTTEQTPFTYGDYTYVINNDNTICLTDYKGTDTEITIPDNIDGIPVTSLKETFHYNDIQKVIIPDSIKEIGANTFRFCDELVSVELGANVEIIGESAFERTKLTQFVFPDSVTTIGDSAFTVCNSLMKVSFGKNVKTIGSSAFSVCSALAEVETSGSIERIGAFAFRNTPWIENQPEGMAYIDKVAYAYQGVCPDILEIKEGTTQIAQYAFQEKAL